MKRILVIVLVLAVSVGALGYWRGWFSVDKEGNREHVQVNSAKFDEDKKSFSKTVSAKAKALKADVAKLWENSKNLTGDDKAHAQKELAELEKKHERLEQQIKDLEDAGQDRFETIKQDLSKNLAEVEKKIEDLKEKLAKSNGK